jgi:histidinol dehydrogenase
MKQMSVLSLERADVERLHEAAVRLARLEGLGAHAHAIEVRLE